jgi:hypothetical protein
MKRSRNSALAVRISTDIDHCCRQVLRSLNGTLSSGVSLKKKPPLAHSRSRPLPISDQGVAHDRTASSFQCGEPRSAFAPWMHQFDGHKVGTFPYAPPRIGALYLVGRHGIAQGKRRTRKYLDFARLRIRRQGAFLLSSDTPPSRFFSLGISRQPRCHIRFSRNGAAFATAGPGMADGSRSPPLASGRSWSSGLARLSASCEQSPCPAVTQRGP